VARGTKLAAQPRRRLLRSRQNELLDEAARHMNARGVLLTSLTDIADSLKVSRAALYYYVDDREDLVFKVYRRSLEILARRLGEAARSGRTALEVVGAFVAATLDPGEPEIAALSEVGLLQGPERETVMALYEGVVARLASVLEAGAKAGEIRDCDFDVAARCIVSMIHWVPLAPRWKVTEQLDRPRLVAFIRELVSFGLAENRTKRSPPPEIDVSPLVAPAISTLDQGTVRGAKREAILLAASRLFNAKGVDTTSLDEIAAALGTNKRALYRYVGDKQAIVAACYERAFRIAFFISDLVASMGLSAADQLDAQQRGNALVQQNRDICPLRQDSGLDALSPEGRSAVEDMVHRFTEIGRRRFCAARADGDFRDLEVDDFLLIAASPSAWLARPLGEASALRQAQIASEIADFVRVGLSPLHWPFST
jgi:AcrR family transcriptional regulator